MALFSGQRDASLVRHLNKELIIDIVDTEVDVYTVNLGYTKTNLYQESEQVIYNPAVRVSSLIRVQRQEHRFEVGEEADVTQTAQFGFLRDLLVEAELVIEKGCVIQYNDIYWEVDNVIENQYWGSKNPDYAKGGPEHGYNVSIVANTVMSAMKRIDFEQVRGGTQPDDTELPPIV